jgi:hypothetical protein
LNSLQQMLSGSLTGIGGIIKQQKSNFTFITTNYNFKKGSNIAENDIRSRIRNIRRFLTMANTRLNRLQEIQSGAPLDNSPGSAFIVGSYASINEIEIDTSTGTFVATATPLNPQSLVHQSSLPMGPDNNSIASMIANQLTGYMTEDGVDNDNDELESLINIDIQQNDMSTDDADHPDSNQTGFIFF